MSEIPHARVAQLERALDRLQEALAVPVDAIVRDACIQRFEFTFEMAWKAIQVRMRREGIECFSPRDCLRAAFRLKLFRNVRQWMDMVENRNRTSHTYSEAIAQAIYVALPTYTTLLAGLARKLKAERDDRKSRR